jgi:muramoyltetrapeptide carboxypeptidase LdcA involved in peptidoglycan recycling
LPHQLLTSLPGISVAMIQQMDQDLMAKRSAKAQKDIIRDFLRVAADEWKENEYSNQGNGINSNNGGSLSILDRAVAEESLLHKSNKVAVVEDIPEKLVLSNRKSRAEIANEEAAGNVGLSSFRLPN